MRFVDTNVYVRFFTQDDPAKAAASYALFQRVADGQETLLTSEVIVAEVVYVLSGRAGYNLRRHEIAGRLWPVLSLPGLKLPHKRACLRALELYVAHPRLDFEDALALAHMERAKLSEVVSYDTDFDGLPGVRRDEP